MKYFTLIMVLALLSVPAGAFTSWSAPDDPGQNNMAGPGQPAVKAESSPRQRMEQLKTRIDWVVFQRKQYEKYIEKQERILAGLERQRLEMERLEMELAPFLVRTVGRLEKTVGQDLDFLSEERQRRIHFLQKSLDDYEVGLTERLRRVLEALRVEAGYGRDVEKTEAEIRLNGQTTRVELLRLGRIALFYKTRDSLHFGRRLAADEDWRAVTRAEAREIKKAFSIVEKHQAAELVDLPLGPEQP